MSNGSSDHHFELAVNISIEALKSLLILNGGAAVAFIALSAKTESSVNYSHAILYFGFGSLLTVIAFAFGYFSELSYANHRLHSESGESNKTSSMLSRHNFWQTSAIVFVILGLICSILGMASAWEAIPKYDRNEAKAKMVLVPRAPPSTPAAPGTGAGKRCCRRMGSC